MREPVVDTLARAMATRRNRRRLLGLVAAALIGGVSRPRPAQAMDRNHCQRRRQECFDSNRSVCRDPGITNRAQERSCLEDTVACCKHFDWNPDREGEGGQCGDLDQIRDCLDRAYNAAGINRGQ